MSLSDLENKNNIFYLLVILLLVTAVFRGMIIYFSPVVTPDGAMYLYLAKFFETGDSSFFVDIHLGKGYSYICSFVLPFFDEAESGARFTSFVFGMASIGLCYHLGVILYNPKLGLLWGLMIASNPYVNRFASDVLTETIYQFIILLFAYLSIRLLRNIKNIIFHFLLITLSLAAYYVKSEGVVLYGVFVLAYTVISLLRGNTSDRKECIYFLSILGGVVLAISGIYFLFYSNLNFRTNDKLSQVDLLLNIFSDPLTHLYLTIKHIPQALSIPCFFLMIYFFFTKSRKLMREEIYLLLVTLLFYVLYLVVLPERRYFCKQAPLLLGFAALGFFQIKENLTQSDGLKKVYLPGILFLLFLGAQYGKSWTILNKSHQPERELGEFVLSKYGEGRKIFSQVAIVPWYAKAELKWFTHMNLNDLNQQSHREEINFLSIGERQLNEMFGGIEKLNESGWFLAHSTFSEGQNLYLFELRRKI